MKIDELKHELRNGEVEFSYRKKDGNVRTARGTLKSDLIPEQHHPKDSRYVASPDVTRYYDLNSGGWRSFRNDSLIEE